MTDDATGPQPGPWHPVGDDTPPPPPSPPAWGQPPGRFPPPVPPAPTYPPTAPYPPGAPGPYAPQGYYATAPYGAPAGYGHVPAPPRTSGLAIASLVLGIVALVGFWLWGLGVLLGLVAIGLGIGARRAVRTRGLTGGGLATAGIITGVLGVLLSGAMLVFLVWVVRQDIGSEINSDPSDGYCDESRYLQDPDCGNDDPSVTQDPTVSDEEINSDPSDGYCDESRYLQDPDC